MPEGIGAWLQFAQAHGKQLAVPEWGVDDGSGGGGDDPYYVEAMHRFFADNASQIAYEAYFDEWSECSISGLLGGTAFPQSAAKYRALWDTTAAGGSGSSGSGSGSGSGSSGSGSPGSGSSGSGSGSSGGHRPGKVSLPRHHGWRWLAGHGHASGRGNGSSGARVRRVRGWGHRAEAHHRRFRPYAHWHRVNRRHHRQGRRRRR
jgi:hypothetical protein